MWFTREHFSLCNTLRARGLEPRFEVGDVVARGFADLGFEEFQVLPGPRLLSLTAGTVTQLPDEHRQHFFWIPSVDEAVALLEIQGYTVVSLTREEAREWRLSLSHEMSAGVEVGARTLHEVVLRALVQVCGEERQ